MLKNYHIFRKFWLFFLCLSFIVQVGNAFGRSLSDGELYTFTRTPMLVPYKSIQVETAYLYNYKEETFNQNHASLSIRTNPIEFFEFQLGTNTYIPSGTSKDNSEKAVVKEEALLGLKFNVLKSAHSFSLWQPGISLVVNTAVITSSEETVYTPSGTLAFSWFITKLLKSEANASYAYLEEKGNKYSQTSATFCLKLYLFDFNPFVEYYSLWPGKYNGRMEQFINGGISVSFSKQFMVFMRGGRGIVNTRETYVGVGTVALWHGFY